MKKTDEYKAILWHKYLQSGNKEILQRYLHSVAVLNKTEELIERFNLPVDREKARLAAILHDFAKFENEERFIALAHKYDESSAVIKLSPKTWHALLGPYVIMEDLGLKDKQILNAVRWHTTGNIDMDIMAEVIFLADFIDESRIEDYFDEAKTVAKTDFHKAISLKIKQKMEELNDYSQELIDLYNKYAEVKWNF
ncbi:MAG: bis(5'-nucleosyl)-tetraphosphatase (symmetrical) YqeK [Bacilli bacterium]|nr:bis(5'-nucleosyl)-tetraphosphatase (symmetrical) YqeK [Bacilli bacterium]MDD4388554.1 bis(5'-nucleosyl)-tetraphosphatase (symmetrical) YqeK [Bacilli bacterium]